MPAVFAVVHLEASFCLQQEEPTPPHQLRPQWMGGGALRGGPLVRAGLSWGKCDSISGSVSSRHKIINRVFIAGLLCWVSLGLSARSQSVIDGSHVPRQEGVRCKLEAGPHQTAETADMAWLAKTPALLLLPQGYPLTIFCPVLAYTSQCLSTA